MDWLLAASINGTRDSSVPSTGVDGNDSLNCLQFQSTNRLPLLDETSTRLTKFKDFQMIVNQISRIDKR